MEIKRLCVEDKSLIEQCDSLFKLFLADEYKYDKNTKIPESLKSFSNDLTNEHNFILAGLEDNKVTGFLYGYIENKKIFREPVAVLCFLYIDEPYRNKGIGSSLVEKYIEEIKNQQVNIVEVKAYTNNIIANKLYSKFGFNLLWSNYRKKI